MRIIEFNIPESAGWDREISEQAEVRVSRDGMTPQGDAGRNTHRRVADAFCEALDRFDPEHRKAHRLARG